MTEEPSPEFRHAVLNLLVNEQAILLLLIRRGLATDDEFNECRDIAMKRQMQWARTDFEAEHSIFAELHKHYGLGWMDE